MKEKNISLLQLIKIRKKLRTRESSVPGKNTVRSGTSYRQTGTFQMTDAYLQDGIIHCMIEGKLTFDFRYGDITHHSCSVCIQKTFVQSILLL